MLLRHAIGAALRRIRLERGLTLRDVSRASSVSMPYLSEIERGRKEASSEVLATVCRVLDLTVFELLGEVRADAVLAGGVDSRLGVSSGPGVAARSELGSDARLALVSQTSLRRGPMPDGATLLLAA